MDKVERVYRRLKAEGKIQIARNIVKKKWLPNFKAGMFKRIKYNPLMNELPEDDIEFCLLHEEGHFKHPVKLREWFYLVVPFLMLLLIAYVQSPYVQSASLGAFAMFIFLLSIHYWFIEIYQKYEYWADEYASNNIPDPLVRIYALDRIPKKKINKFFHYIAITLGIEYIHPRKEERIERIKERFSKN